MARRPTKTRRARGMVLTDYNRYILRLAKLHPSPTAIARAMHKAKRTGPTGKRPTANQVSAQLRKLRQMGLLKAQVGRGRLRSSHEKRYHKPKLPKKALAMRAFTLTEMIVALRRVS